MTSAPRTARARARDELTREIKDAARAQLAQHGADGLSLRAVARELGLVSSALYRYFPSRDELLTALILDAYRGVGEAAARADEACPRDQHLARWLGIGRAVRTWARAQPHEWALIFGSPVPGYVAPQDTADPASRIPLLMVAVVVDAGALGRPVPAVPSSTSADLLRLRDLIAPSLEEPAVARCLMAWTQLVGGISFELFGHLVGSIEDYPAWLDVQLTATAEDLGLT